MPYCLINEDAVPPIGTVVDERQHDSDVVTGRRHPAAHDIVRSVDVVRIGQANRCLRLRTSVR